MAITTYTGTGGTGALMDKLQELHNFVNLEDKGSGTFNLYLTEQVYIQYNTAAGWADVIVNGAKFSFVITNGSDDNRAWEITQTSCGFVLSIAGSIRAYIAKTIDSAGAESWGVIACGSVDTSLYAIAADGMAQPWTWLYNALFVQSNHYTQMYNATPATAPVYFPDLYIIACSPITANRQMMLYGKTYYASKHIALADK